MFTVPAPCQRVFVGVNRHVKVIALHSRTLVLHNTDTNALYVQNRAVGKKCLVCRHCHICLNRPAAGGDAVAGAANVRVFFCAVRRAQKLPVSFI